MKHQLLRFVSVVSATGLLAGLAACTHWPDAPYTDALATPPDQVKTTLAAKYPGVYIISPVYRWHTDRRSGYVVESQYFIFEDLARQKHRGEIDEAGRMSTQPVTLVDKLPDRLHTRFFDAPDAPAPGGQLRGQAWVMTGDEPIYEFEFESPDRRGIGRISESAKAISSFTIREPGGR